MPDWTYRTLFRRPLFALPFRTARWLAFSGLGTLAKIPGGSLVIEFFGHTTPPCDLAVVVDGVEYCSPVGLGSRLDPQYQALSALARFGVGWVEIDPVFAGIDSKGAPRLAVTEGALHWQIPNGQLTRQLPPCPALAVPLWQRISWHAELQPVDSLTADQTTIGCAAGPPGEVKSAAAITLDTLKLAVAHEWSFVDWRRHVKALVDHCHGGDRARPLYVVVPLQFPIAEQRGYLIAALESGAKGFLIADTALTSDEPATEQLRRCRQQILRLRNALGPDVTLIAAAGIHSPEDAIECWRAGATLVQVDIGMIFAGPGLPKRINEARRFYQSAAKTPHPGPLPGVPGRGSSEKLTPDPRPLSPDLRPLSPDSRPLSPDSRPLDSVPRPPTSPLPRSVEQAWFWLLLLGLSMFGGGMIAWAIAATRVVLPYDEAYLEMTRAQIAAINPQLLHFMTHDRITLAGTMLAIGVFYSFLAWHAVRKGSHWAWLTILASALSGFASFFLFLFFGYFDPFHALVTAILFQLLLAGWQGKLDSPALPRYPNLRETRAWKLAQWGQLLFVAHGAALIVGGAVICYVGSTTVFVHEDLEFMRTTREELLGLHPRLIPVVAHDRASFGGMLIANGLATMLSALWGFRQGDGWQWWMYALAGALAYGSTLIVHYGVGYSSSMHLAPAFAGMPAVVLGLALSYPYLMGIDVEHYKRWKELLK